MSINESAMPVDRLIDMKEVVHLRGVSRWTIYRMIARGEFPEPVEQTGSITRWSFLQVQANIAALKAPAPAPTPLPGLARPQ